MFMVINVPAKLQRQPPYSNDYKCSFCKFVRYAYRFLILDNRINHWQTKVEGGLDCSTWSRIKTFRTRTYTYHDFFSGFNL